MININAWQAIRWIIKPLIDLFLYQGGLIKIDLITTPCSPYVPGFSLYPIKL